jgi:hypothetical protein
MTLSGDGFKVYLGRDGPVNGGGIGNGTPIKEQLIFDVINTAQQPSTNNYFFPPTAGPIDDAVLPLYAGHSYGYIWETKDDVVPTGLLEANIMTDIVYGGGGL